MAFQPLVVLFSYRREDGAAVFIGRSSEIVIEDYVSELYLILRHCNGYNTIDEVQTKTGGMDLELFDALVSTCVELEILCDSRELYRGFHIDSENPMQFAHDISPGEIEQLVQRPSISSQTDPVLKPDATAIESSVTKLALSRSSNRSLSDDRIEEQNIWELLQCMYTTGKQRSTPSAGKLYPLEIYMVVTSERQHFGPGVYRYDPARITLSRTDLSVTSEKVAHALDLPEVPGGVVLFVTANFSIPSGKYANRGYRYALLEAGHVAQNAYLFAAESELGIVEYGGYNDKVTAKLLGLDYPNQAVLTTLIVGKPNQQGITIDQNTGNTLWELKSNLVGPGKPVAWVQNTTIGQGEYLLDKVLGVACYNEPWKPDAKLGVGNQCYGLSTDSRIASIKAIAEAYERHCSGLIRYELEAAAVDLTQPWLDPRVFTPFDPQQYALLSELSPFNPDEQRQWVAGYRYNSGERILVPVEHAFYPVKTKDINQVPCYSASSSGVAAHFDYDTAVRRALLELIERDAISVTWYAKRQVTTLPDQALSASVRYRKEKWEKLGWEVKLLNITTDSIPVVLALITSDELYPHALSGASASQSFEVASDRALEEAEVMLTSWRFADKRPPLKPEQVVRTLDHGLIYFQPENLGHLDWLRSAPVSFPESPKRLDILAHFNPVVVDLAKATTPRELNVVRVMSEILLPINFGYGCEHYGHHRLSMLGFKWARAYPSFPHLFA